jgi:integral membrane sensor domain MASE1
MARLAAVCLLVPVASAAGGASLLSLAYGVPFGEGWENWYLATACGLLTVTPLLLSWTDQKLRTAGSRRAALQTLALSGLVAVVGYLDFHDALPGLFLVFPLLLLTTSTAGCSAPPRRRPLWPQSQSGARLPATGRSPPSPART